MERRAWRLALGCVTMVLGVTALVLWRAPALSGGWSTAVVVAGSLAVVGLLASGVLAVVVALRPLSAGEVLIELPVGGPATSRVSPASGSGARLGLALGLAAASALPALLVLVLSSGSAGAGRGEVLAATTPAASATAPALERRAASEVVGGATGGSAAPTAPGNDPAAPTTASAAPTAPTTASAAPTAPSSPTALEPPTTTPGPPAPGGGGLMVIDACLHVVVVGDTLWGLASAQLDASAPDASIAAVTHDLYEANADLIGQDPDLIHPGDVLDACP